MAAWREVYCRWPRGTHPSRDCGPHGPGLEEGLDPLDTTGAAHLEGGKERALHSGLRSHKIKRSWGSVLLYTMIIYILP